MTTLAEITEKELKKYILKPTILISLISAITYLAAYSFEIGYLGSFGLGLQSAQVQLSSFLLMCFVGLPVFLITSGYVDDAIGWMKRYDKNNAVHRKIHRSVIVGGTVLVVSTSLLLITQSFAVILSPLIYIAIELVWPFVSHPRTKGYGNKIIKEERIERHRIANHILTIWFSRVCIYMSMILLLTYFVGWGLANIQNEFDTFQLDKNKYVVLRDYGGEAVSAKLNSKNKLSGEYKIINLSNNDITLKHEKFENGIIK